MSLPIQKLKIDFIVIGNQNSGKTSIIRRFVRGQSSFSHLHTPTIGLHLQKKTLLVQNQQVTVCVWDTAGQQKFFALTKNYFNKADGILIIFDLTDRISFSRIEQYWMEQVNEKSDENCVKILVGNKVDKPEDRQVLHKQAEELANKYNLKYFQTSAKTGEEIDSAFMYLTNECVKHIKTQNTPPPNIPLHKPATTQKGCFSGIRQFWKNLSSKS